MIHDAASSTVQRPTSSRILDAGGAEENGLGASELRRRQNANVAALMRVRAGASPRKLAMSTRV
jgi:hypothetical protein